MAAPILMLQGKVDASNALVVTGVTPGTTTTPTGGGMPLGMVQGRVDSTAALVVAFV